MNLIQKYYRKVAYHWMSFKGETSVSIDGIHCKVPLDSLEGTSETYNVKRFERKLIQNLLTSIGKGDTFLDVGANIGVISCLAGKKVGSSGKIIAVEPFKPNIVKLKHLKEVNNLSNIDIVVNPLSNKKENVKLRSSLENNEKLNGVVNMLRNDGGNKKAVKGDSLFEAEDNIPNTIKIDVEGAEGLVLEGLEKTLEHPECTTVLIEIHYPASNVDRKSLSDYGYTEEGIRGYIERKGFEISTLKERKDEKHIIAQK